MLLTNDSPYRRPSLSRVDLIRARTIHYEHDEMGFTIGSSLNAAMDWLAWKG